MIQGDTVNFFRPDSTLAKKIVLLSEHRTEKINGRPTIVSIIEKAFVSDNGKYLLFYHLKTNDSVIESHVKLTNADGKTLWHKKIDGWYQYNPYCAFVHNQGFAVILKTNYNGREPVLYGMEPNGKAKKLNKDKWLSIVSVVVSNNGRYVLANTRQHTGRYIWDYLLFMDLKNYQQWTFSFYDCLSCSRPRSIILKIDDDGTATVTYKYEVYTFASDGRLIGLRYKYK